MREDVAERMSRQQIIAHMEQMIATEEWAPGMKLPINRELADYYGTSTTQMDTIMEYLKGRGLIISVRGGRRRVAGGTGQEVTGPIPPRSPEGTDEQPG